MTTTMIKPEEMKFEWQYCAVCNINVVICPKCGNNCCNGGYGKLQDGRPCDVCVLAYQYADLCYQNGLNPPLTEENIAEHTADMQELDERNRLANQRYWHEKYTNSNEPNKLLNEEQWQNKYETERKLK